MDRWVMNGKMMNWWVMGGWVAVGDEWIGGGGGGREGLREV